MKTTKLVASVALAVGALALCPVAQAQINEHTFRFAHAGAPGHPGVMGPRNGPKSSSRKAAAS